MRNAALTGADAYRCKSNLNAKFDVASKVKKIIDIMPILTKPVASKIVEKMTDKVHQSISSSIWWKIKQQDTMTLDEMIKFRREQKHDELFGALASIVIYRLTIGNLTALPKLQKMPHRQSTRWSN